MPHLLFLACALLSWAEPPANPPARRPGAGCRRGPGDGAGRRDRQGRAVGRGDRPRQVDEGRRRRPSAAGTRPDDRRAADRGGELRPARRRPDLVRLRLGGRHRRAGGDPDGLSRRQGGQPARRPRPRPGPVRGRDHRRRPPERPGRHRPPEGPGVATPALKPLALGDATRLRKGSFLLALGNPFNAARDGRPSASWGILSNVARRLEPPARRPDAGPPPPLVTTPPCSSSTPS